MIENLTSKLSLQGERLELAVVLLIITVVSVSVQALIYRSKNFNKEN